MNHYGTDDADERARYELASTRAAIWCAAGREHLSPQDERAEAAPVAHLQDLVPLEERADLLQLLGRERRRHEIALRGRNRS